MPYRSILLVIIFVLYSIPNSFALFHSRSGGMPGGGGAVTNVAGVQITNEKRSSWRKRWDSNRRSFSYHNRWRAVYYLYLLYGKLGSV
jgi:hypothetical protein